MKTNNAMSKPLSMLVFIVATFLLVSGCKKDDEPEGIDLEMYNMARMTDGFTWYKNSPDLLDRSNGSGHSQPFLRTRYNTIAAAMLDSAGKVSTGAEFPEGSLVVKELYENSSTLYRYAILFKKAEDPYADDNGWVWGYIDADGSVAEPASKKGTSCINCHSQEGQIDYMLMNKYFP